jgi:archaemetzincin
MVPRDPGILTRRQWLTVAATCLVTSRAIAEEPETQPPPKLVIVPLGRELLAGDVDFVMRCLAAFYSFQIEVLAHHELPRTAYYAPRKRFRAEKLLKFLDSQVPAEVERIVGLTAVDISTTKGSIFDWGVLGLATLDGRVGVLSNFRCARGTKTAEQALVRFGKTAVHEVGHTLGLEHCPTVSCLMEDAKGTVMTTDREYDLCRRCRKKLVSLGRAARDNPVIPWPKPGE